MKNPNYSLTKTACYMANISMAAVGNISPLLFITFKEMYGISYTLLGLLVVFNFTTQLIIDLVFTFFSKHFNIHKTVRNIPVITALGLVIYAVMPMIFPQNAYIWLALGTIVFSVSAGLSEVLISPVIAAIPAENPEREMSKLHSTYAWGFVGVVIFSTIFLKIAGTHNWHFLALILALIPAVNTVMFRKAFLPEMSVGSASPSGKLLSTGLILCALCIFLGGASECTMSQWVSGFAENAIGIPKIYGDIFGMALFAAFLGTGRTLYARFGKNIINIMLLGMIGGAVCYFTAALSLNPIVGLAACILTGFCVSMLWPGTLIYAEEKITGIGVAAYALLAAGGDFGASVAPQLVGIAADAVGESSFASELALRAGITAEQIGIRSGIMISGLFPIAGIIVILFMKKYFKNK